jgi:hypothetical protein
LRAVIVGYGQPAETILRQVENILHMDAILAYDENGQSVEPECWKFQIFPGSSIYLLSNAQKLAKREIFASLEVY